MIVNTSKHIDCMFYCNVLSFKNYITEWYNICSNLMSVSWCVLAFVLTKAVTKVYAFVQCDHSCDFLHCNYKTGQEKCLWSRNFGSFTFTTKYVLNNKSKSTKTEIDTNLKICRCPTYTHCIHESNSE